MLAAITQSGKVRVEHIIVIALLTGLVTALNAPAWQAYITDLVGPSELLNAIALNSTQFNLSRVIGPSIAGILLALIGAAGCFFVQRIELRRGHHRALVHSRPADEAGRPARLRQLSG